MGYDVFRPAPWVATAEARLAVRGWPGPPGGDLAGLRGQTGPDGRGGRHRGGKDSTGDAHDGGPLPARRCRCEACPRRQPTTAPMAAGSPGRAIPSSVRHGSANTPATGAAGARPAGGRTPTRWQWGAPTPATADPGLGHPRETEPLQPLRVPVPAGPGGGSPTPAAARVRLGGRIERGPRRRPAPRSGRGRPLADRTAVRAGARPVQGAGAVGDGPEALPPVEPSGRVVARHQHDGDVGELVEEPACMPFAFRGGGDVDRFPVRPASDRQAGW